MECCVEKQDAINLANKEGLMFFEVSAKSGENVKKMFYSIVAELPFFEEYGSNKNKLINELGIYFIIKLKKEIDNSDNLETISGNEGDTRGKNGINLPDKQNHSGAGSCKC